MERNEETRDREERRTAGVVVDTSLGKHGIVLNLRLLEGRAVVGDDDEPSLSLTEGLEGALVAESVLSTLHHEGETRVDALHSLLLWACKKTRTRTRSRNRNRKQKNNKIRESHTRARAEAEGRTFPFPAATILI